MGKTAAALVERPIPKIILTILLIAGGLYIFLYHFLPYVLSSQNPTQLGLILVGLVTVFGMAMVGLARSFREAMTIIFGPGIIIGPKTDEGTTKYIRCPYEDLTKDEKTLQAIVKVPVSTDEAKSLYNAADKTGKSRGEWCREVLLGYLSGNIGAREDQSEAVLKLERSLQESKKAIEDLQRDVKDLTAALDEKSGTLDAVQKELQGTRDALQEIRVAHARLEGEAKGQATVIDDLRGRAIQAEGLNRELTTKIPLMVTVGRRKPWWQFWKSSGDA